MIFSDLIKLGIDLLNTDKPKIGRHIIEFLSFWIQALKCITRSEDFHEFYQQALVAIMQVMVQRLAYPAWFTFGTELSDYEEDYIKYREEFVTTIFTNIASVPLFKETLFKVLADLL